jgi:aryl-alcohol dehydrogenase-like predicted oxidoreductase
MADDAGRIALGTVQFGLPYGIANGPHGVAEDVSHDIVSHARRRGLTLLDTAIGYGESERILGEAGVAGWDIVTKLPALPDGEADIAGWVERQIAGSLERLKVDRLHGVLLHRPDQLSDPLYDALRGLQRSGVTQKIGISIYDSGVLETLMRRFDFQLVQAPLNILDQGLVASGWLDRLKRQGVEVHARSLFLQGLLLMPADRRPAKFARWGAIWSCWDQWLAARKLTPLQACLGYIAGIDAIDQAVVGVVSCGQLDEILAASATRLDGLPSWPELADPRLVNPAKWTEL